MEFNDLLHPAAIIEYGGLVLLLMIVFAETGLFFGFFLPGDSLLFVAGILAGSPYLPVSLWQLTLYVITAAVAGTCVGYGTGHWAKGYLLRRRNGFFFRKEYIEITARFYQRYGMMAFVIGRFAPIIRTFVPILAGIAGIGFGRFTIYNLLGAIIWAVTMIMGGYWLGNVFPQIEEHLDWIIIAMIVVTALPIVVSLNKHRASYLKTKA